VIYRALMDYTTLATILFRVFGVSYVLYGIFYAPYLLITAGFTDSFLISSLLILTYFAAGIVLFIFSRPLAALAVKGLKLNDVPAPPPPPHFEN
jgi:hypothetical protein